MSQMWFGCWFVRAWFFFILQLGQGKYT